MSDAYQSHHRGGASTRHWARASISIVARLHGVTANLLYRWRRLMTEGGAVTVQADDAVTGNAERRRPEDRMRA